MLSEILELQRLATKLCAIYDIECGEDELSKTFKTQIKLVNEKLAEFYNTNYNWEPGIAYLFEAVHLQKGFLLGVYDTFNTEQQEKLNILLDKVVKLENETADCVGLVQLTPFKE